MQFLFDGGVNIPHYFLFYVLHCAEGPLLCPALSQAGAPRGRSTIPCRGSPMVITVSCCLPMPRPPGAPFVPAALHGGLPRNHWLGPIFPEEASLRLRGGLIILIRSSCLLYGSSVERFLYITLRRMSCSELPGARPGPGGWHGVAVNPSSPTIQ